MHEAPLPARMRTVEAVVKALGIEATAGGRAEAAAKTAARGDASIPIVAAGV